VLWACARNFSKSINGRWGRNFSRLFFQTTNNEFKILAGQHQYPTNKRPNNRVEMAEKRSHSEANASENNNAHGGGKNRAHAKKPWKRQKVDVSAENLATIKKRARALERLFSKDNSKIPADKQIELERELAAHKKRIAEAAAKKHRSDMIGKYHMVRFFGEFCLFVEGLFWMLIPFERAKKGNKACQTAEAKTRRNRGPRGICQAQSRPPHRGGRH